MKTRRKNVEVTKVEFKAIAGAEIFTCINECIAFSAIHEIPCTLSHNGIEVPVSAFDLSNKIYKLWDLRRNTKEEKK